MNYFWNSSNYCSSSELLDASPMLGSLGRNIGDILVKLSKDKNQNDHVLHGFGLSCLRRLSTSICFSIFFSIIASYMYQKLNLCMNFNTSESMWNEQEGVVGVIVSVAHISSQFIPMLYETCCSLSKMWKEQQMVDLS